MISSTVTTVCGRFLIASVLLAIAATASNAQAIGNATAIKSKAVSPRNAAREIGKIGATDPPLEDTHKLGVGRKASIRPDKNTAEPNKPADAVTIETGSYRFVTGSPGKRSYRIKTPYGALDVHS